jgi:serine/threonine protein kinase
VTALFHEALERDGLAQIAYLDAACADDRTLRAEVESLLAAHQAAGNFAERSPFESLPVSAVAAIAGGGTNAALISSDPSPVRTTLVPGSQLGPYEIVGPINAGGMGELFRARDTRLGRDVALKVPSGVGIGDTDRRQRFQREARAIAALNHPHICTIYDVGFESGIDYLVLELLHGESLAARLKRGPLPIDEALARAIEIARAIDSAHRAGIVHRDLKPGNVMLTPSGAKVLDFGVARIRHGDTDARISEAGVTQPLTETGALLGTLQYMAPEQLEGRLADARADIFAFGATLFEMLTGKRAFDASSSSAVIGAVLHRDTPSLLGLRGDLPPALERIVGACLQKDPEARLASMHDLAIALQWVRDETRAHAPSLSDTAGRRTRHATLALAVVALISDSAASVGCS